MSHSELRKYGLGAVLVVAAAVSNTPVVRAQVLDEVKALKVKAAYLYNFAKFVTWPETAFATDTSPLVIGVFGDNRISAIVEQTVRGKTVGKRSVHVRRVSVSDLRGVVALRSCHIVYVGASRPGRLEAVLRSLDRAPVLVVGESRRSTRAGAMIGLVIKDGRIAFEINRVASERCRLKISAKLLKLGKTVAYVRKKAPSDRVD